MTLLRRTLLPALASLTLAGTAHAHGGGAPALPVPNAFAPAFAPAAGRTGSDAAELKFADMFSLPVGPQGLEPGARLLALHGRPVRLVGYMAGADQPVPGRLILTPLPVRLGDDDEGLADDLPPSAVFVHLSGRAARLGVPNLKGLLQLTGTLRVGAHDEPDGRVSTIRLLLNEADSQRFVQALTRAGTQPPARPAH